MSRRALPAAAWLAALCLALPVSAQPAAPDATPDAIPEVGDVPAGEGSIAGRVLHAASGESVADVEVMLYAVDANGRPGIRRTTSGPDGGFAFEGVASRAGVAYLLGARHDEVPFVGERVVFEPGQTRRAVELRVADRGRDAGAVRVEEARLRLARSGDEIAVAEIYRLRNGSDRVFYATAAERDAGAAPALHALLPEGVARFALPYALEPEGLVREGRDVRFFGPVYPGSQEIAFTYSLPAREGAWLLRKRWPSGADRVRVLHPPGALTVDAEALAEGEKETVEGVAHRVLETGPLARGAGLALALEVPAARRDPDALGVAAHRAFLELDAEALLVTEELHLEVEGDAPLVAPGSEPLLRVPLPAGARELRFGTSAAPAGMGFEEGALTLRGPLPPGASRVDLRYRLPAEGSGARFERTFERRVPTVTVYVADTGLVVESRRLHRRRPVKAPDERVYMHFEAFHVTPGESVDVALTPLPPRTGLPATGRATFVIGSALLVALFLSGPLRGRTPETARAGPAPGEAAREEREAVYVALRDLEHDYETAKVVEEDYGPMREELRRRAAGLMRAERAAAAREAERAQRAEPAPAGPRRCPACHAEAGPDARFCSQCGRSLEARGAGAPG